MVDYTKPTGTAGTIMIRDLNQTVEFRVKGPAGLSLPQMGFSYTYEGQKPTYDSRGRFTGYEIETQTVTKSFSFQPSGAWQVLEVLNIPFSQNVKFHLMNTGNDLMGGPTDLETWIQRGVGARRAYITVNGLPKAAIPYVKVTGVWKEATAMVKQEGYWRTTI